MPSLATLSWALLLLQPCLAITTFERIQRMHAEALANAQQQIPVPEEKVEEAACNSTSCYQFYNAKTKPYFIESFPEVPFSPGEFYGGSVPINESDPSRTLFFLFKPTTGPPVNEITIWLNGGPGCSSLVGFFQENGPILWQPGVAAPVMNKNAWSTQTNMIWVEQPVGTGFAQGKVEARNEVDVAEDFIGFFKNWQKIFGIKNHKIYITGESYAGRYVPYIGAQMLDAKDTTYYNLKGALVYDPCIGDCNYVQMIVPTYYFALNNNEILNVDPATMATIKTISQTCGFTEYSDKYLRYPPAGPQPPEPAGNPLANGCNVLNPFYNNVAKTNPCFNIYHITDYCPLLSDVVSSGTPYFNRMDVKKAIHAPLDVTWTECTNKAVFVNNDDTSPDSRAKVLPQVIEATNRVLVSNAQWDALIPTNGTLLTIQNMTWNGKMGFQSAPSTPFVVPGQGVMGKTHNERGLQWVETYQAGHMQPQYQPRATLRHLQWLLGRIPTL